MKFILDIKRKNLLSLFVICTLGILISLSSCAEDDSPKPPSDSINKIMPLGASRVEGARPSFESYRYELWKQLVDGGWDFDYIGTMTDDATYPVYQDSTFDMDHEGRGGWTSGQILNGLSDWLNETGAPDIVLFSSPGGNDGLTGLPYNDVISNINAIIDTLQNRNPSITIIIEQLAPGDAATMTPERTTFFNNMQNDVLDIASQQTTSTSKVLAVDMFTGFNESLLADDVHYNEAGAKFIADRYYTVLQTVLKQ